MNKTVKAQFLHALSRPDQPFQQCQEVEHIRTFDLDEFDAYGLLAALYIAATLPLVGFVPMRGNPDHYFLQDREGLMLWSGISPAEITNLIDWNDSGLTFTEIADKIYEEWS